MPNMKPSILYPSRRDTERRRDHANEQIEKFYEIFKEMSFEISFTDALILMPKFASTLKALIGNKEKLNRSVSKPIGIAKDVLVKVGVFHFPADFVNKAITYNLDQTSRYSANYDQMTANKIDVTDEACEEYSQEVLGFSDVTTSGSPTPSDDPIVSTTSPTLTLFGDSDFLLFKEADAFLGLEDDPDSLELDPSYYDPEGDILSLEAILNSNPSPPLPNHDKSVPSFNDELKACEAKTIKSFIDEPPEVELKDLPPHLEYAFLKGDNKFPVIIAKAIKDEEKSDLIKILMEEDYKPVVQNQRRVNPKIYDVIKKEVEKLLDAGLIYPIFDSPWVSPVHCVPKKGGFTVVTNEENELIPTRLVTRWRVCIDYRKLNEVTRKDHFPLPFMDQMLERLAGIFIHQEVGTFVRFIEVGRRSILPGSWWAHVDGRQAYEYYCFLDGFSGYFQIPIDPRDQENTTFTCPYGTFAYRRMPFGLCNAPGTFQRWSSLLVIDLVIKEHKGRLVECMIGVLELELILITCNNNNNNRRGYNNTNNNIGENVPSNRGPNLNLNYKNYGKIGHTIERCYELVGFPTRFKKSSNSIKQGFNANIDVKKNEKMYSKNSSPGFTSEQMQKLFSLINETPTASIHANMAGTVRVIMEQIMLKKDQEKDKIGSKPDKNGKRGEAGKRTIDMTIDQQVALDEALVPHTSRLRIGKSNFRLRSDITSKESTLQLATAIVHHHSIRFKMNNKKRIVNLEYFREMLHISPRLPNQTFDELPFEEEIMAFLRYLGHSGEIRKLTDLNINKNSAAYEEYYAVASGAAPLKTKASVRKTQSSSDTTITPPIAAGTRLSTLAKGKQPDKSSTTKDKGTGSLPGILDVPADESDEEIFWKSTDKDDDDEVDDRNTDNDGDDFVHPKLSVHEEEAKDEESFDPIVQTPKNSDDKGNDDASLGMNVGGEEGQEAEDDDEELSRDVNINLEGRDVQMTDVHTTQEYKDTYVTLTPVNLDGQQHSSSVSSQFVTSMLNPSPDAGIDSFFESIPRVDVQASTTVAPLTLTAPTLPPSTIPTISKILQAPTPPTTAPSTFLQDLPNFGSLFGFDHHLKTLEANFFEFVQTNQFAGAVSSIHGIVERYMDQRMNEAVKEQVKERVKVQVSKILPKIEKTMNEQLEAEVLTRSSNSSKTSFVVAADLSELELKKILIEKIERNKSI
uniref:Reverse transcriptase domain-containing protein n=1 Tax=Tanacetum cinerariifolium TaxID=118510 RepID=A0A6L2MLN6_TANCI|nr:reverse transcriptase domain-containing protein [Tanacetum cinerariifolium]